MKNKTILKLSLSVAVIIVAFVCVFFITADSHKPLYGRFECTYKDGAISTMILSENSVYFDNLDYDIIQKEIAGWAVLSDVRGADVDIGSDEFEKLVDEKSRTLNIREYFDKREVPIRLGGYDEATNTYQYYIVFADATLEEWFVVDLDKKSIYFGGCDFYYKGKK